MRPSFAVQLLCAAAFAVAGHASKAPWSQFPLPPSLWVQNEPGDFPTRVLQRTLSGLATRATLQRSDVPALWIRPGLVPDDRWRGLFTARTGVPAQTVSSDVIALVKQYAGLGVVKGFVTYAQGDTSVNVATSLCAPLGAVAVADTLVGAVQNATGLRQLADARTLSYADILAQYTFNEDLLTLLHVDQAYNRDMAVASGTLVTLESANGGYAEGLKTLRPGTGTVIGWGLDEHDSVSKASAVGASVVASDWTTNWAILSSGPAPPPSTFPQRPAFADDGRTRYVAFVLTDGDNVQWTLNDFTTSKFWFAATQRGQIPFTWGIAASALSHTAPDVLRWYQSQATPNDSFVNYGDAYAYLDTMQSARPSSLSTFVAARQPLAHSAGVHTAAVFLDDWTRTAAYETFVRADPDVRALFPVQYSPYAAGAGRVLRTASRDVPVVSAKISLWDLGRNDTEFGDPQHVADVLNAWAGSSATNVQDRVAWVPVHAWSKFPAPPDAADIAVDGQLGGYTAALYASRHLASNICLVTLDDIANLLH